MIAARKIMLLGEIGVGKTSLIRRLVLGKFEGTYKGTLGFDLYTFKLGGVGPDGDDTMPLVLWDTDGNVGANIFRHDIYMQGTSAALIIGDLTRPETIDTMLELERGFTTQYPGRHVAFVLNKADLVQEPQRTTVPQRLADTGLSVMITSAKTGDNVENAFRTAANAIIRRDV